VITPVQDLFESHLTVASLERSMAFYGGALGFELAHLTENRQAAFYWLGGPGDSMLGLWETGAVPQRMSLHVAFRVELANLLEAPSRLRAADITPLDFWGCPSDEPTVLAWMPAVSVYFHDPDGNLLEFLSMLPEGPRPDLNVLSWSRWRQR
jgi:lactoylglutathione lyase